MDKQDLRECIWDELEESGDARFPFPPHGRIPNFAGADEAAQRLSERPEWSAAETIKINPDSPQRPVRQRALEAGKTLYMAVPRLRDADCFLRLDPDEIDDYHRATTIAGSSELGIQIGPDAVESVDLIVSGSVVVNEAGARIGKGEGYSDLEYALLDALGLVDDTTPVVTTVHELQVVDEAVAVDEHDVPLDLIVTPERAIETNTSYDRSDGIDWSALDDDRIEEMPVLQELRDG
ncbi:5-formyltetrahydrofolate cyclo-ligase [Natranaeroarchaeum sulfidigenes]|uniref:5-formyltetrahydrofolate cyclo-ligase n=1 Tax=Natranaeroarchaeum sulfidigenes TaxID=2784880 RepID=A0A897MS41_9EURY|nr:5-formyltetrahydrofolate cyclo-ligase [Natranaeroarchaeum sulfidigenes]QSG03327.1 5-formyltetrahydrofolate cyclo-ligase [Natranaeroarchaeum sulfidigenes]